MNAFPIRVNPRYPRSKTSRKNKKWDDCCTKSTKNTGMARLGFSAFAPLAPFVVTLLPSSPPTSKPPRPRPRNPRNAFRGFSLPRQDRPPAPTYPPLIHRMLHVFVQKHATLICHNLADLKKSFFNFPRKYTNPLFMLRFYDPKHATTPVIRRDLLCPADT